MQASLWLNIGKYIILQAIILLGGITFKNHALIKTTLSLGVLFFLLFSTITIFTWIFCPNCPQAWQLITQTLHSIYFTLWIVIAPICWIVTYLKLTEYELR